MPRGSAINRTGTVCRMLGHMGCDLHRPKILDKLMSVIVLIAPSVIRRVVARLFTKAIAASRSAMPVAGVTLALTSKP